MNHVGEGEEMTERDDAYNPGNEDAPRAPGWAPPGGTPAQGEPPYAGPPGQPGQYGPPPQQYGGYPQQGPPQGPPPQGPVTPTPGFGVPPGPGGPQPGPYGPQQQQWHGPGTPPPFPPPGPGQTPPPFPQPGYPGYQPPKKKNTGLLIGGIAGGGVLILIVVIVIVLASGVFSSEDPKTSAVKHLATAASSLSAAKAVKYHGTVSAGSQSMTGDFKVTTGGRTTATATWGSSQVEFIQPDDKSVYIQAGSDWWSSEASFTANSSWNYVDGTRWGRRDAGALDFDFKGTLAPTALAAKLRTVNKYTIRQLTKTTVNGQKALKITSGVGTNYYLSDGDSPRLLRVESTLYPTFQVDVDISGGSDALDELRTRINQLKDSFDASTVVTLTGLDKGSCDAGSCTLKAKVSAIGATSASTPVIAYFWITQTTSTGTKLGDCTTTATTTGSSTTDVSCTITSSAWSSFRGDTSHNLYWYDHAIARAGGASTDDISALLGGIDQD